MDSSGGAVQASRRLHSSKPPAPLPPQKVIKYNPVDVEIQDVPPTFTVSNHRGLLKPSQEQTSEPQGLDFRKLDDQTLENDQGGGLQTKTTDENKLSLAHTDETLLATFYGMLYTNDGTEKEWKLELDGFIPVCFIQVHGNANKPFIIIAVEKTKRIMEYQVTVNTTCARNSTFVKWQDGASMFGVRFAKEDQAEQFFSTVKRMASTLARAAQLLKQPERKAVVRKMSDPASSSNIQHTKVSLMIKLPDKQTTIMSVPGLLTMSELFETICEKEHLNAAEHQLSLPRMGARKVTFDSGTAIGSLKIREVSIIRAVLSDSGTGSAEVEDESFEDLLDIEGEENKILHISFPTGIKKSYRVSLDMTMKQLVMRVCSRESLNPRHHSLQYIDFKHEFLDMASTVHELGVNQVRLMDKRGRNLSRASITDDNLPLNSSNNIQFRKSSDELVSDSSAVITVEDKDNNTCWNRSKSLDVLANEREPEVFSEQDEPVVNKDLPEHSAANGSVPTWTRRNSSDGITNKRPPTLPMPYVPKSASLTQKPSRGAPNGRLKDQSFSPIKKNTIISASTPDLSSCSSKSDDSPVTGNIKTSTPDFKSRRRAAPPPPPRPAVPKALFTDGKPDAPANKTGLPEKKPTPVVRTKPMLAPRVNDVKLKPPTKKRPAPPRPVRPPPPQPARQSSTESKDSKSSEDEPGKKREVNPQFKQNGDITSSVDLVPPSCDFPDQEEGEDDLRGVPIFIPPPPPVDLPPPLDECETPVGPLTDFEADILEGSPNDNLPVQVNGFVGIGKYLAPSQTQTIEVEQMQTQCNDKTVEINLPMLRSKQETALETVPEHASIPVVPPPPMYSETTSSSSEILHHTDPAVMSNKKDPAFSFQVLPEEASNPSLADIPPPLLETEVTSTSQDSEEKDHDSGFDQSPENLNISPPADPSDNVPVQRWEDPDSGSSLDVMSAIPPPMDFATTRPLTPPCQFANPTVAPPVGFVEEEKKEKIPEKTRPRKKLNISEKLFPWMNEPQASINATVPLAVAEDKEDDLEVEMVNGEQKLHTGEKMPNGLGYGEATTQSTSAVVVVPITTISVNQGIENQTAGKPSQAEVKDERDIMLEEQEVQAKVAVSEIPRVELPRTLSSDKNNKPVVAQKVEIPKSNGIKTDEVVVLKINSKETEQPVSQQVPDVISKPVRPETRAKPITLVREQLAPQLAPTSFNPSTEVARQERQVEAVKLAPQVKPEKQEKQVRPVTVVKEAEVKIEAYIPSSINVSRDSAPVKPELQVQPEKPETESNPVVLIKETEVRVEAYAPSSFIPAVEAARPEKPKVQVKPENPETRVKPNTLVKEEEIKVEPKADVPQSFNPTAEVSRVEPKFKNAKPVVQVKPEEPKKLGSRGVEEVITPQVKPVVERSIKTLKKEQPVFVDNSLHEVKSGVNTPLQESAITIITKERDDVVMEAPVTPERKPTPSSHDKLKDLEERLLELDKETVPSSTNSITSESKLVSAAYSYQEPTVQSKDPFSEDVIVAETKQVEFSSYEQFEQLLKLDNEANPSKYVAGVENKDEKADVVTKNERAQHTSSSSHIRVDPDLRLDLSSLRRSPEPPRPPSSSPPAAVVSPRSSILPSPRELHSDRSTESGISLTEEPKSTNSVDPNGDKESKPVQTYFKQTEVQTNISAVRKPHIGERPTQLHRPLSMPAGMLRDFKSETVQEKNKSVIESDSRKSSSSESSGISSPSPSSSPVESGSREPVDLPKPLPFTVLPLRRYSDLASDLSFISSAAKAAGKSHDAETKADVPPKPVNLALKRSTFSAVERPHSWVGPDTNNNNSNNKRSMMFPSAFKPVSFETQGKKSARPVEFNVKSFNAPSRVTTAPSTKPTALSHNEASTTEKLQAKSSPKELEKPPKHTSAVAEKPPKNPTSTYVAPVFPPQAKAEPSSMHQPLSTGTKNNPQLKKLEPPETKYEILFSNNSSETQCVSKDHHDKTDGGSRPPFKGVSSAASIREQIMRDATGGNKVTRARPQSAFVGSSKFPIFSSNEKSSSSTGANWADVKKLAALQTGGVKSGGASWVKKQASEPSKPDVTHIASKPPQPVKAEDTKLQSLTGANSKPQPVKTADNKPQLVKAVPLKTSNVTSQPVKTTDIRPQPAKIADIRPQPVKTADTRPQPVKAADVKPQPAVNSGPLPNVVMRTKTGQQDPTKRHSMPTYIIQGADGKQLPRTNSSGGQFRFIVNKEVNTDTTVVPQGVVAAMKALREKKASTEGD